MRPLIGLSSRNSKDSTWAPILTGVRQPYVQAVVAGGGAPMMIPLIEDMEALRALYDAADGILLPGGEDISPAQYGEQPHPKLGSVSEIRDAVELQLARWAVAEGKPLLAICRGLQVLNVALGGTLYQDLDAQIGDDAGHERQGQYEHWLQLPHGVVISEGSQLAALLGTTELQVNSLHHQAIKDLAPGLEVVAKAPDGVVEAVEGTGEGFVLGVQCHPEMLWDDLDTRWQRVFSAFIEAARIASTVRS